jgi:hypothetical protein
MWTFRRDSPAANGAADGADFTPAMRSPGCGLSGVIRLRRTAPQTAPQARLGFLSIA